MAIDQSKLNSLRLLNKPSVGEVLAVYWSDEVTSYYSWTRLDALPQFRDLPFENVEARLIGEPFREFELNGDVKSENISIDFDDVDGDIKKKFQTYSAARCELFYYYPDVDLLVSVWWGQLNKPEIYGYKSQKTQVSNGFRSRQMQNPRRPRPHQCPTTFGGRYTSLAALRTNGCPYDFHLGGSLGLPDPTTGLPFKDCPRLSEADCIARFGHDDFYLGFNIKPNPVVSDPKSNFITTSRNSASILKEPIGVTAGRKFLRGLKLLVWRPEPPDYIRGLWEIGEGRVSLVYVVTIGGQTIRSDQLVIRYGERGQPQAGFDSSLNFSATAHFMALYGTPGGKAAQTLTGPALDTLIACHGYDEVAVYTDEDTFSRIFTVNRAWWILELHTNQRIGFGYSADRFNIPSWLTTAAWSDNRTRFTHPNGTNYDSSPGESRASFSANLEPRASHEQITDICRSGRISIPFQHDGQYHITPIAAVSNDVLENAKVFTDKGDGKNIVWDDGMPSITLSQISDEKLCNHVALTYEQGDNGDVERPIFVDDPDQKARAAAAMGYENNFLEVQQRFAAFGIRFFNEAIKLAFSLLWFGPFDTGGIKNNLSATFNTPFEQVLGLKRYEIIKIESDLLDGFETPEGNPFEYFRIQQMRKIGKGLVRMNLQAYNKEVYENFETVLEPESYTSIVQPPTPVCRLEFGDAPTYSSGNIVIPPITTC